MRSLIIVIVAVFIGWIAREYLAPPIIIEPGAIKMMRLQKNEDVQKGDVVKPAYLVVLGDVYDREAFGRDYVGKLPPVYAKYTGEYIAVGRNFEVMEGEGDFQAFVISKWPSMDAARNFWNSEEYALLKQARIDNNWGRFDVFLLEGLAAPTETSPAAQ